MATNERNNLNMTDSPCIRNCCLDDDDICLGCFRHIDEIVSWRGYTNEDKADIISLCLKRKTEKKTLN